MDCKICFEKFDTTRFKPIICMPCAHTFCSSCAAHIKECSICRAPINAKKTNFNMLEILEESTPSSPITHNKPKSNQEALKLKNDGIELSSQKKYFEALQKFNQSLEICLDNYPEKFSLLWWKAVIIMFFMVKIFIII